MGRRFDRLVDFSCRHEWVLWVLEAIPVAIVCGAVGYLVARLG